MKIYKFFILVSFMAFISSCGDSLAEINVDPNNSPSARPQEVLTSGIGYYAIALDDNINEQCALMAQYWAGGPGVAILDHERYFFEPSDFNAEWTRSYQQSLSDLSFVIKNGTPAQSGAAQILTANIFQTFVDLYGDIPYSEALKGAIDDGAILTPKYDDAKSIYDDLLVKIDGALANLAKGGALGSEDLIYGGDLAKWAKFGNSLKLKILVRQSNLGDASIAAKIKALVSSASFIESQNEMAKVPFSGGAANNWNPQYGAAESGIGMFYVASKSFTTVLTKLNDKRDAVLFKLAPATNTIVGMAQGNVNDLVSPKPEDFSKPSAVAYGPTIDVILMSHWEVMFLRAEAALRYGTADNDKTMYDNAVTAHFSYIGAPGASAYLAADGIYDQSFTFDAKIGSIAVQKWISMCGLQEAEGWIESRRFDIPSTKIFTSAGNGIFTTPTRTVLENNVFPTIRLYPQSELSFNPNSPKGRKITDKVFWDN